jgi:hypothetical protein
MGDEDANSASIARSKLLDELQWIERLSRNQDFQMFLSMFEQRAQVLENYIQNIDANDATKRDAYAQRYFALKTVIEYAQKRLNEIQKRVHALNESGI